MALEMLLVACSQHSRFQRFFWLLRNEVTYIFLQSFRGGLSTCSQMANIGGSFLKRRDCELRRFLAFRSSAEMLIGMPKPRSQLMIEQYELSFAVSVLREERLGPAATMAAAVFHPGLRTVSLKAT